MTAPQQEAAAPVPRARRRRPRCRLLLGLCLLLIAAWLVIVGPWPAYREGYKQTDYCTRTIHNLQAAARAGVGAGQGPRSFRAGYGEAEITPPIGTPLAGYGDRRGAPSTGVHDPLWVKALALDDGKDEVILAGADLLVVPDSVAEAVLAQLARDPGLPRGRILLAASHTHSGPGGWAPGPVGRLFAGKRDPAVIALLTERFVAAVRQAHGSLRPASIGIGVADAPEFVRNRLIDGGETRGRLSLLAVRETEEDGGAGALLAVATSYSAHATVLGSGNMLVSGDYPGALQRHLEAETGARALFLGGAVGSMGPRAPGGDDDFARADGMGKGLARYAAAALPGLTFEDRADVGGIGFEVVLAPHQWKIADGWRLSPVLTRWLLRDRTTWLHAVRVGRQLWFGTPCDFSGELANELSLAFAESGVMAEVCSFNGDYVGYVLPDRYAGMPTYETRVMNWFGPATGSYFRDLMNRMGTLLTLHSARPRLREEGQP